MRVGARLGLSEVEVGAVEEDEIRMSLGCFLSVADMSYRGN